MIGVGDISDVYFNAARTSQLIRIKACASSRLEAARAKSEKFGIQAVTVDQLLADPEIQIIINLTVPQAHAEVSQQILAAGKHVYGEKPLAAHFEDARSILATASAEGLRVGCAPDTFFGAAHQACRVAIDAGLIGRVIGGAAAVLSHGMEGWHPNPEFFFKRGGGPIHDVGPYYITQLVNLLGPVAAVSAMATTGNATRTIGSEPRRGQTIQVEVPTTANAVLKFANGANFTLTASWDVWGHRRHPIEIYGTEGSLLGTDPNYFGGEPQICGRDGSWAPLDTSAHPFRIENWTTRRGAQVANYRISGVIDMAMAIREGRPHRASGELALHVIEVLEAVERSSLEGRHVSIATSVERPATIPLGIDETVLLSSRH